MPIFLYKVINTLYFRFFITLFSYISFFICHLKKILALVLAFACAFTMFAGAAFTDSADIKATEAVNMLTALGVIDGYEDGSFRPNGTVTRAQMAKMIFVVWNGGKSDAKAYQTMDSAFADTKDHWARGYINFCASNNIIAGKSASTFAPDATVTGQEAAKMLLTVIGYDQTKAGLTGPKWKQNTMSYAGMCGLFDDVDASVENALPRQYAAQMIYNALDTNRVKWSTDSNAFDDVTSWNGHTFVKETVGEKYMGYKTITGILVEANNGEGKGFTILPQNDDGSYTWSYKSGALENTWTESKYTTDLSKYLGEEVKVAYDTDEYAKNKASVFGVYSTDENVVVETTTNKVKDAKETGKIKVDGDKYKVENNAKYFAGTLSSDLNLTGSSAAFSTIAYEPQTANTIKFVDYDNNGKFDLAIEFPMAVAKVSSVTSSTLSLKDVKGDTMSTTSPKLEDINVYDGIKKDDLVVVTYDSFNDEVKVEKATSSDETIGAVRNDVNGDNEEYNVTSGWVKRYAKSASNKVTTKLKSGDKATMVVISGIAYYVDRTQSGTGSDVAVVVSTGVTYGSGAEGGHVEAKLMYLDGKTEIVKVKSVINNADNTKYDLDELTATTSTGDLAALNGYLLGNAISSKRIAGEANYSNIMNTGAKGISPALVTYSKTSDGYTLQLLDKNENDAGYDNVLRDTTTAAAASNTVRLNGTASGDAKIAGYAFDDNATVFVVYGSSDVKKYTGKQAKKLGFDANAFALVEKNNGLSRIKVATVYQSAEPTIANTNDYAYLLDKTASVTVDGTSYIILTTYTENGEETLLAEKNAADRTTYAKGDVITLSYTGDVVSYNGNEYKKVEDVNIQNAVEAAITGWDGKDIQILDVNGATTSFDVDTDDTTVLVVDTDDKKGVSVGKDGIDTAIEVIDGIWKTNAVYVHVSGADAYDLIVVDNQHNWLANNTVVGTGDVAAALQNDDIDTVYAFAMPTTAVVVPAGKTLVVPSAADLSKITATKAGATVKFTSATGSVTTAGQFYTAKAGSTAVSAIAAGDTYKSVVKTGTDTIIFAPAE